MLMKLDIDRLHSVVDRIQTGQHIGRQEGKTEALLQLMLGEVQLGMFGNFYIYMTITEQHAKEVQRRFAMILEQEGWAYRMSEHPRDIILMRNNQRFRFASRSTSLLGIQYNWMFWDLEENPHRYSIV